MVLIPNPLEGYEWSPVNDFWPNLAVSCMTYDPQETETMYIGTGESQTALIIYRESSTTGIGIMKSTDGGKTWELIPSSADWAYVTDIQIRVEDEKSIIYAGVVSGIYKESGHQSNPSDGLYRSVDGGESWSQVLPNVPGSDMPYAPSDISMSSDKGRLFVGTTYGINSSGTDLDRTGAACILYSDDGINWIAERSYNEAILENEVAKYPGRVMIANSESDSDVTYAIIASGYPAGPFLGYGCEFMLKSTDKGESWEEINFPGGFASLAWHAFAIDVNPQDPNIVWLGGLDIWRTLDGGLSWRHMTNWAEPLNSGTGKYVHADIHVFLHNPDNPRQLYVATDGGVFFTGSSNSPDNAVFHELNSNFNTLQYYSCDIHPDEGKDHFVGGLQDNGTLLYRPENVANRSTKLSGGDGAFCFYCPDDVCKIITTHYYTNTYLYEVQPSRLPIFHGLLGGNVGTFINPMDYDCISKTIYCNVCAFDGSNANILGFINIDGWQMVGEIRELATNSTVPYSSVKWDERTGDEGSAVYLGTASGRFFRLLDARDPETLSEITGEDFPAAYISSIDVGQSPDTLLVTFSNYGVNSVWLSTDAGDNWTAIESNLPDMPIRWGIFHPESSTHVMLATETGIWTTNNSVASTVTWSPDIEGMANVRVDMLQMRDTDYTVLAATHGRGLFTTQWKLGATSSRNDFILLKDLHVFPNPTNGRFKIEADFIKESHLSIMDVQGRIVVERHIEQGECSQSFDLSSESKGIYLVRIQSGDEIQSIKILVK